MEPISQHTLEALVRDGAQERYQRVRNAIKTRLHVDVADWEALHEMLLRHQNDAVRMASELLQLRKERKVHMETGVDLDKAAKLKIIKDRNAELRRQVLAWMEAEAQELRLRSNSEAPMWQDYEASCAELRNALNEF